MEEFVKKVEKAELLYEAHGLEHPDFDECTHCNNESFEAEGPDCV